MQDKSLEHSLESQTREDILISVCFSDIPPTNEAFQKLRALANKLDSKYRFREIIIVADDRFCDSYMPLVEEISDLRLLTVPEGVRLYDRRLVAAEEAIGDVILIAGFDEIQYVEVIDMLEEAANKKVICLVEQSKKSFIRNTLFAPVNMLGNLAGFTVNLNNFQTISLPRTMLNQILSHSDPQIALRFPPKSPMLPITRFKAEKNMSFSKDLSQVIRRMQILQRILAHLSPFLLTLVAICSSLLALIGFAYALYIVIVLITVEDIAPGWLTTSTMLTVTSIFMGISTLGLSLALQHLLNLSKRKTYERVVHEVNQIDLFGKVASDLNVNVERNKSLDKRDQSA
nr:hypothetical protein [Cytophagales bacterium]